MELWFKKKCCSILYKFEIKKKYKMLKKLVIKGVKFFDICVYMLYMMFFLFYF